MTRVFGNWDSAKWGITQKPDRVTAGVMERVRCQVYVWPLVHISQMWTVWITVLVAFNRYVAICRPFQAIRVCTMRQARLQVLASAVVIVVYNIPRFLEHQLEFYQEV